MYQIRYIFSQQIIFLSLDFLSICILNVFLISPDTGYVPKEVVIVLNTGKETKWKKGHNFHSYTVRIIRTFL